MIRRASIAVLVLLLASLLAIPGQAQTDPPGAVFAALADLNSRAGFTITLDDLTEWRWTQQDFGDTSLGCPQQGVDYAQVVTSGYQIIFNYNGAVFDYRATLNGSNVFLCSGPATVPRPQPTAAPTSTPSANTGQPDTTTDEGRSVCDGAMNTRLTVGFKAQSTDNGIPKNIRQQPTTSSQRVGQVAPGALADVVGGPECAQGMVWWQVEYEDVTGWIAEGQFGVYWYVPTTQRVASVQPTPSTGVTPGAPNVAPTTPTEPTVYALPAQAVPITRDNAATVTRLVEIPLNEPITDIAWSPDGRTLAVSAQSGTWLYGTEAITAPPRLLQVPNGPTYGVAFNPDQITMATAHADTTIRVWDIGTGGQRAVLRGHTLPVLALAYSPDGMRLASGDGDPETGDGGIIQLWDTATGTQLTTLQGHTGAVTALAFNPDGTLLASAGMDQDVRLWDVVSGTPAMTLTGHSAGVKAVVFSADGLQVASAGNDGTIFVWDITTGNSVTLPGHGDSVTNLIASPDGTLLVSGGTPLDDVGDNSVRIWDFATGESLAVLDSYGASGGAAVEGLAFSPDASVIAFATREGTSSVIRLWGIVP